MLQGPLMSRTKIKRIYPNREGNNRIVNDITWADIYERSFTQSGIMKIYVGPKRKLFDVHKELLTAQSGFFRTLLSNENWKETQTSEIYWNGEGETIEAVKTMVDWLYGKGIDFKCQGGREATHIIDCYGIAQKREVLGFKNALVDEYRSFLRTKNYTVKLEHIELARQRGLRDSPLHDLLFSLAVWLLFKYPEHFTGRERQESFAGVCSGGEDPELLVDVIEELLRLKVKTSSDPRTRQGCHFHDHADGSSC